MTIHFLCMSWCLTGGNNGRGAWSDITSRGGEARPSMLFAPLLPGGPLPLLPRQQHRRDRRNPPPPLDFLLPRAVDPDTGVPSPSLCWLGVVPKTIISHEPVDIVQYEHGTSTIIWQSRIALSRLLLKMLARLHVLFVYLVLLHSHNSIIRR